MAPVGSQTSVRSNILDSPGSKILLLLQDLRRILTRTSCKILRETYKIASKMAYKISCQDALPRLLQIFFPDFTRSYKLNKLFSSGRTTDPTNMRIAGNSGGVREGGTANFKTNTVEEMSVGRDIFVGGRWYQNAETHTGPHIMMKCIVDNDVCQELHNMTNNEITGDDGLQNIFAKLDSQFLTSNATKFFNTWTPLRKTERVMKRFGTHT